MNAPQTNIHENQNFNTKMDLIHILEFSLHPTKARPLKQANCCNNHLKLNLQAKSQLDVSKNQNLFQSRYNLPLISYFVLILPSTVKI